MSAETTTLSNHELEQLAKLEDKLGRGESVRWDEPKTIRGFVVRDIETVDVNDYSDPSRKVSKRVLTLRTATGLAAIWEGPAALEELFEEAVAGRPVVVAYQGEKVGQESGRSYKSFSVVVGKEEPEATAEFPAETPTAAVDDIPF